MNKLLLFLLLVLAACTRQLAGTGSSDTPVEARVRSLGLVDIAAGDSLIAIYLAHATPYDFVGRQLYHGLAKAFARAELPEKLIRAKEILKSHRPDLTSIVYDAVRPISIQHGMWSMVKDTLMRDFVRAPATDKVCITMPLPWILA